MKTYSISIAFVTIAILAILSTDSVAAMSLQNIIVYPNDEPLILTSIEINSIPVAVNDLSTSKNSIVTPPETISSDSQSSTSYIDLPTEVPEEVESLKEIIPETIAEVEAKIFPLRNRFLMWTYDLRHIMWGCYGNGFFAGTDNLGKRAWGVYGEKVFAGIYDGDFFWGKYCDGRWKAKHLFGEQETTHGRYVLSPTIVAVKYTEETTNSIQAQSATYPTKTIRIYSDSDIYLSTQIPDEAEKLKTKIPSNLEKALEEISPSRNRFLMWTYDLRHIMWGCYGNGFFAGTDNLGKRAWGVYGEKVFAGIYDGDFFWGFYGNGRWRAFGLFGKPQTFGRYLTARPT